MPHEPPSAWSERPNIDDVLAEKRRRLGTALHQLARDLAEARRRNRQLERELERIGRRATARTVGADTDDAAHRETRESR